MSDTTSYPPTILDHDQWSADEMLLIELFRSPEFDREGREGDHDNLRPCQTAVWLLRKWRDDLASLRAENAKLQEELKLWRPLTVAEAQAAYDAAEAVPMSEEQIQRILKAATDPAHRLTNAEEMQLHVRIDKLHKRLAEAERELERWWHGETIEGDFVCPNALRADEAERQRDEATAACAALKDAIDDLEAHCTLKMKEHFSFRPQRVYEHLREARKSEAGNELLAEFNRIRNDYHEANAAFTRRMLKKFDEPLGKVADSVLARLEAAEKAADGLAEALRQFGKRRQFNELCYCDTIAGLYCTGQERCRSAQAALAAHQAAKEQR